MAEHTKSIDLASEVVQSEYFQKYLAKLMEWLFINNPTLRRPTPQEQENMQESAIKELRDEFHAKFSQSGVEFAE
jgi:hypothetical protein